MRVERLAWAESQNAKSEGRAPKAAAAPAQAYRRTRLIHREVLRPLARWLDAVFLSLATLTLCLSAGVDLWRAPFGIALPFVLMPAIGVGLVWMAGGYRFRYAGSIPMHLLRVTAGAALAMGALALWAVLAGAPHAELAARVGGANAFLMFGLHANYLALIRMATRTGNLSDNVVIVGATPAAASIVARNRQEREINILGYFDDRTARSPAALMGDAPYLGDIDNLLVWERLPEVDRIVVAVTSTAQSRVRKLIDRMRSLPQELILVLDLDGFSPEHTSLAKVLDAPAAYISGAPKDIRRAAVKRIFDLIIALSALAALALPMLAIALLIKLDSPGPVFFRQKRHGFNNEIIRIWKFRSMRPDRKAEEGLIRQTELNDPRVTRIGRILRKTSLDELPQLFNVIAGEMSLVGPRPHAIGMTAGDIEAARVVADYAHRHRVKPGMTGWAQINGSRGPAHTPDEVRARVRYDMEYIRRASLWLDGYIILMTIPALLGDRLKPR